jgi:hypothetical protein
MFFLYIHSDQITKILFQDQEFFVFVDFLSTRDVKKEDI